MAVSADVLCGQFRVTYQDLVISKGGSVPKEFTQYDEEEALRSKTSSPAPPYLRRNVAAAAPKS